MPYFMFMPRRYHNVCFFVQKTATKSERSCYCSKEGMCISCFVSHMVKISCFYKIQGCALSRVSCRVLNS